MRRFQGDRVKGFMQRFNMPEDEPIEHGIISKSIAQAQVRVEGHNFDVRKRVLEYDDVVNIQRERIYTQRAEVLRADSLRERYLEILEEAVLALLDEFVDEDDEPGSLDALRPCTGSSSPSSRCPSTSRRTACAPCHEKRWRIPWLRPAPKPATSRPGSWARS